MIVSILANSHFGKKKQKKKERTPHNKEVFINFQLALANDSVWRRRGAESLQIGGLLGQCAHCTLGKKGWG